MTYQLHRPSTKSHIRSRLRIALLAIVMTIATSGCAIAYAARSATSFGPPQKAYINEVKSGGSNTAVAQYVTIYNPNDNNMVIDNWTIEYAKQAFAPASCGLTDWKLNGGSNVNMVSISGILAPHTVSQPFSLSINDNDAGSIHIVDEVGNIRDTVGWGTDTSPAPCFETAQASKLTAGKSLQRYIGCDSNLPIDGDDNSLDFLLSDTPRPGLVGLSLAPQCTPATVIVPEITTPPTPIPSPTPEPIPQTPSPTPTPTQTGLDCTDVIITEILPNPASTDTGHEFIELHNPTTDYLALDGCSLQTSANSTKEYDLTGTTLSPDEYLAVYDSTTGLTLPNAAGGTVSLFGLPASALKTVTYPADMEDATAWSLQANTWYISFTPTPNAPNLVTLLKPCDAGQVRNPDTNRCADVTAASNTAASTSVSSNATSTSNATACKVGQERNPDTNRCRNIVPTTAASSSVACKAGQERNPETNRCKNIVSAASTAKDCPTGQERNPDTNRCRKVTAAGSSNGNTLDGVKDVASATATKSKPYVLIAALAVAAAIAYGVYEWRQEIMLFARKQLGKVVPSLQPNA